MTSPPTVGIGAAARLLGTTQRALRYYEQRGLLAPADINYAGHRRYDESALRRAGHLLALRKLGLSLATIAKILAGDSHEDLDVILMTQSHRLDADIGELIRLRNRIAQLLGATPRGGSTDEALNLLEELAMKIVLSRIYTRTGDDGTTALAGGNRVDKTDPRLEVIGDVDELVSAIGVAIAAPRGQHAELLRSIQNDLFDLGADLAATAARVDAHQAAILAGADYITRLEQACDEVNASLEPPSSFVLPGSNACSAALHHARAICRRAERHSWAAVEMTDEGRRYLNRLSDLLFILARSAETDIEPTWVPSAHQPG